MTDAVLALRRRKFLVVVDTTSESKVAQRFAARRAEHTGGVVTLLAIVPPADPQAWAGVEEIMRAEAWEEAERQIHEAARDINKLTGLFPELWIREGRIRDEVKSLIGEDKGIAILVLGAGTGGDGPGPLVALAAGPAAHGYTIPVTIVPGGLTDDVIDAIA